MDAEIQDTVSSGIPVIFYNSDFPQSGRSCYIGMDNYTAGVMAAEAAVQNLEGKGRVLVILRRKDASSQTDRITAVEDTLADYPEIELVGCIEHNGSELELKEKLLQELKQNPMPDAILCMDEIASDQVGAILENLGENSEELFIVALDQTDKTEEYIRTGVYDLIVTQDIFQIGYCAVKQLNGYYETKEETGIGQMEEVIYLDNICITEENIEEYVQKQEQETLEWNSY
jgi:ribose transport system substrate-binding protein